MKQLRQSFGAGARRLLRFDFLILCFGLLLVSSFLFSFLFFAAKSALSPWWDVCCPIGWPPGGSWAARMNDYFEANEWILILLALSPAAFGLVQLIRHIRAVANPCHAVSAFLLVDIIVFVGWLLLIWLLQLLGTPLIASFSWLAAGYGGISYGAIIGSHLAVWPVIATLIWLYSGHPRAFWSRMLGDGVLGSLAQAFVAA